MSEMTDCILHITFCGIILLLGFFACNAIEVYISDDDSHNIVQTLDVAEIITIVNKEEVQKEEQFTQILPSGNCLIPVTHTNLVTEYRVTGIISANKIFIVDDQMLYNKVIIGNTYNVTISNLSERDDGTLYGDIKKIEDTV